MSGPYLQAIRSSHRQTVVCDAWRDGAPVAENLEIAGGSVTDTSTPGVRRQLDVELVATPGLFDLLAPIGTELRVRSVLRYPSGATETVPMGVFDIDSAKIGTGPRGSISVSASDLWVRVQRARFLVPKTAMTGHLITDQIAVLLREVFGEDTPVANYVGSTATVGSAVWDEKRDEAINDLAESIGAWVYADRDGAWTIAPLPMSVQAAAWRINAGEDGILLDASRSADRAKTYNVVVASSTKADGEAPFPPQIVWDDDPTSATYAGTDPVNGTDVGPFGIVPYFYESPLLTAAGQAWVAASTILARVTGRNSQLSLSAVRNHALDALDAVTVTIPPERPGLEPFVERHLVDKIVHPLMSTGDQAIETRASRAGEVES